MDNKNPSFAERIKQLAAVARKLEDAVTVVRAELQRMDAAAERFARERQQKTARR
ncbi:MAG: hypothetical protein ABL907_23655 [Hyphomicrobium sp.]